jgi:peroxiredoxin Q/BCP
MSKKLKRGQVNLNLVTPKFFTIYQDLTAQLADPFNIPSGYQFHGQVIHYPALVLLDEKGKEVFRYIGKYNGDRFSFEKLKAKIQELKATN